MIVPGRKIKRSPQGQPQASRRWLERLFEPVDIASLVFFRLAFGGILLWEVWRYFANGWINSLYIAPAFHFTYYGFEWVKPWPGAGMYLHFLALGILAALVMLGMRYRVACTLLFVGLVYVLLLEKSKQ